NRSAIPAPSSRWRWRCRAHRPTSQGWRISASGPPAPWDERGGWRRSCPAPRRPRCRREARTSPARPEGDGCRVARVASSSLLPAAHAGLLVALVCDFGQPVRFAVSLLALGNLLLVCRTVGRLVFGHLA